MSQSSVPWTSAAIDPCLPSIEQETYTQEQLEQAFSQTTSDEPVFTPVFNDDLDEFDFSIETNTHSNDAPPEPSNHSTPDYSSYTFNHSPFAYPTVPNTPQPYPIEHQQTSHQPIFQHRSLPFRAHTNSPFALPSHPPQKYDRRRSLSHSAVDRITAPPHPTFVRLQAARAPHVVSYNPGATRRSGHYTRHGRSVSQPGRPLKNTTASSLPGSPLVGTHIGTPLEGYGSRKRVRPDGPYLARVTDPAGLARSRHIIEVGAMAVRQHGLRDADVEGLTAHERVERKVRDVEEYLRRGEGNEDALRGCGMIREALGRMRREESGLGGGEVVDADVPSKMMDTEDGGIFGAGIDDEGILGLLMREKEVCGGGGDDV